MVGRFRTVLGFIPTARFTNESRVNEGMVGIPQLALGISTQREN